MKKVVLLAFCAVVLCGIMALGLGSCKKADYSELLSENRSVRLKYTGDWSINHGVPAQFALNLSPNINPEDIVAVFTTDEGEVVKSPQGKSVYVTFTRPGTHTLDVKIYLQGMREKVLCQDMTTVTVK